MCRLPLSFFYSSSGVAEELSVRFAPHAAAAAAKDKTSAAAVILFTIFRFIQTLHTIFIFFTRRQRDKLLSYPPRPITVAALINRAAARRAPSTCIR